MVQIRLKQIQKIFITLLGMNQSLFVYRFLHLKCIFVVSVSIINTTWKNTLIGKNLKTTKQKKTKKNDQFIQKVSLLIKLKIRFWKWKKRSIWHALSLSSTTKTKTIKYLAKINYFGHVIKLNKKKWTKIPKKKAYSPFTNNQKVLHFLYR